jgi:hypothetical protein
VSTKAGQLHFGAWCGVMVEEQPVLAHARFTPSLLYRPGLTTDIAYSSLNRAIWAGGLLGHDPRVGRDAVDLVMERCRDRAEAENQ